ncbi:MAG: DUF1501 domain-containing protein [Planctomycetia bacterium]|nr:DUF1501 domain-containing protein [Planctomycetia bacterium]
MLTFLGRSQRFCDRQSRRDFLKVGALGLGGLTLADLLRARADEGKAASGKSVIMVWLGGGPSHIDMYDMKPDAPAEYRGEFKPIQTSLPGLDICELLPLQAKLADKMSVIRNFRYKGDVEHEPFELLTGVTNTKLMRPSFGSVVSKLHGSRNNLPPYVSLMTPDIVRANWEDAGYLGLAHRPFFPTGPGLDNLTLTSDVPLDRLDDRKALLRSFDGLTRQIGDRQGELAGYDSFTARALEMISTPKARAAFDLDQEPTRIRNLYGKHTQLLQARRLVEAGVPVVTTNIPLGNTGLGWDTHQNNFKAQRSGLPSYDQAVAALISDIYQRGLDQDVAVCIWGEMGRTPRVNDKDAGRDHWYQAGFGLIAGGGLKMGQVIGATDGRAERIVGKSYTPNNMLATLYHVLGINPECATVADLTGRPNYLLDDAKLIEELL